MKQARLSISDAKGRLSFTTRVGNTRPWWRDLDLDGKPLYRIGNICNTCEAFFSKSDDAQLPLAPSILAEHLRSGLEDIPENILDTIAPILPKGDYVVGLLSLQPA